MEALLVPIVLFYALCPVVVLILAIRLWGRTSRLERDLEEAQHRISLLSRGNAQPTRADTASAGKAPAPAASTPPAPETVRTAGMSTAPVSTVRLKAPSVTPSPAPKTTDAAHESAPPPRAPEPSVASARVSEPEWTESNLGEVDLMKWWLPRIGGTLAVLAAVFFGVYVNRDMTPGLRCLEMALTSLAFIASGLFLERKNPAFGGVVTIVGCVMTYVTSFAAYAFIPTKVIGDVRAGAVLQAAVLAAIVFFALARRSRSVAAAAFLMAWPMTVFMAYAHVGDILLLASVFLCLAGTFMSAIHPRYDFLAWMAAPLGGASLLFLTLFSPLGESVNVPWVFAYLAAIGLAAPLAPLFPRWCVPAPRAFAGTAAALAGLGAYVYFHFHNPGFTGKAYLLLTAACLAGFAVQQAKNRWSVVAVQYAVKASVFASLWIVADYAGSQRWAALLVQSAGLVFIARREKSPLLAASALATALLATGYFLFSRGAVPEVFSPVWFLAAFFPLGVIAVLAAGIALRAFPGADPRTIGHFRTLAALLVPLLSLPLAWKAPLFPGRADASLLATAYAGFALLLFFRKEALSVLCAPAVWYLLALVHFLDRPDSPATLAVLVATAFATAAFAEFSGKISSARLRNALKSAAFAAPVLAVGAWIAREWAMSDSLTGVLAAAGLVFTLLSRIRGMDVLRLASLLLPLFLLNSAFDYNTASIAAVPLWLLTVAYFARGDENRAAESVGGCVAALWMTLFALDLSRHAADTGNCLVVLPGAAGAFLLVLISRVRRLRGAPLAGLVALAASIVAVRMFPSGAVTGTPPQGTAILAALFVGLAVPFLAAGMRRSDGWKWIGPEELVPILLPLLSWSALAVAVFVPTVPGELRTALLAAACFFIVTAGFFLRDRYFRIVGLLALAVPAIRLIVYDLHDPIHRIVAFGAGGILTLILGYFYHALSGRIQRQTEPGEAPRE